MRVSRIDALRLLIAISLAGCGASRIDRLPPAVSSDARSVVLLAHGASGWAYQVFEPRDAWRLEASEPTELALVSYARPPAELVLAGSDCAMLAPLEIFRLTPPAEGWARTVGALPEDLARVLAPGATACSPCKRLVATSAMLPSTSTPTLLVPAPDGRALVGTSSGDLFYVDEQLGIEAVADPPSTRFLDAAVDERGKLWAITSTGALVTGWPGEGLENVPISGPTATWPTRVAWHDGYLYVASRSQSADQSVRVSFQRHARGASELLREWSGPVEREARLLVTVGGGKVWMAGSPSGSLVIYGAEGLAEIASPTVGGLDGVSWIESKSAAIVVARLDPMRLIDRDRAIVTLPDSAPGFEFFEQFELGDAILGFGGDPVVQEFIFGVGQCPLVALGHNELLHRVIRLGDGFLAAAFRRNPDSETRTQLYFVRPM